MSEAKLVTLDYRGNNIYSASLLIPSESRKYLDHHVTIYVEVDYMPTFSEDDVEVVVMLRKYTCTCEDFIVRGRECKHVRKAYRYVSSILQEKLRKEWLENKRRVERHDA